jgi:hypothetical protein
MEAKELTANQLFKQYKDDGGTLNFSNWLSREKKKGVFPLNQNLNEEVYMALNGIMDSAKKKDGRILGFPKSVLFITGAIIIGAIVYSQVIKNKKK